MKNEKSERFELPVIQRKNVFTPPVFLRRLIASICPLLRHFPIDIRGQENLLQNEQAVFVCNHSNSHDLLVAMEVFSRLHRRYTFLAARDGLNAFIKMIFILGNAVLISRASKESRRTGFEKFCCKIQKGESGLIFPESTWNLHPTLPMHQLNAGFLRASLTTGVPVIPVIFEYIEVPDIQRKESKLYTSCVVTFGMPIVPSKEQDLFEQAEYVRTMMADMRKAVWKEFGIKRDSPETIDRELYLNHLDLKKNHAVGFRYDSALESRFLLDQENDYCMNERGEFVPNL